MINLLLAIAPVLVKGALMLFDFAGASSEQKRKFLDMTFDAQDDALTPIQFKDDFAKLRKELKETKSESPVQPPEQSDGKTS